MITLDGNGIAATIGAAVGGVVLLGNFAMTWINWKDGRDLKRSNARIESAGAVREGKIDSLHSQVNGRLGELKVRIAKESFEVGRKFQRDNGDAPSPEMPRPKVEELMDDIRQDQRPPIS